MNSANVIGSVYHTWLQCTIKTHAPDFCCVSNNVALRLKTKNIEPPALDLYACALAVQQQHAVLD